MSKKEDRLFKEFPPVPTEKWEEVIKKDLRGADYKEKLNWKTGEGIEALPFYRKEHVKDLNSEPLTLKSGNRWEIRQPVFDQDIIQANETARRALERGAEALQFRLNIRYTDGMPGGDLEGIAIQNQSDFNRLLEHIDIEQTALHFDSGMATPALLSMLYNENKERKTDKNGIQGTFLYGPFAFTITNGLLPKKEETLFEEACQLAQFCAEELPGIRPLGVDAKTWHNAGATIVQEVGFALAAGSEYLARLTENKLTTDEIAAAVHFSFSVGSNYFLEIAKLRAVRKLWAKILDAYDAENTGMYLHGESSAWNKTVFDPYTNMLRFTTEGMSAAIAGCDAITLNPFDLTFKQPDEFSQRISRNAQIILKEEAYLNKVADPSAGSYYIEQLTDKIAQAAWKLFQEIETQGGLLQSIRDGYVQTVVEESRQKRDQKIAARGRIFVGTNQYANADEKKSDRLDSAYRPVSLNETDQDVKPDYSALIPSLANAFQNGCALGDVVPEIYHLTKHYIRPIRPYRGARAFEELRLATENHDTTPTVLTLPLGRKKMRKARSAFTSNFFGCAGYHIEEPIGFESVEEAVAAVKEKNPEIVVLCSSDEEYKKLVPTLCNELNQLDDKPVTVLAGYPEEHIEAYKKTGIDEFIHAKCNVLETLNNFQQKLGII